MKKETKEVLIIVIVEVTILLAICFMIHKTIMSSMTKEHIERLKAEEEWWR